LLQPSPSLVLPSSHTSPASRSTMPLPHFSSDRQSREQPSPPLVLPSSQISPGSRTPLPHFSIWQLGLQPSPGRMLPSSHCSPESTRPLPHGLSRHTACTAPHSLSSGQ